MESGSESNEKKKCQRGRKGSALTPEGRRSYSIAESEISSR
jgi:hypothetical protein